MERPRRRLVVDHIGAILTVVALLAALVVVVSTQRPQNFLRPSPIPFQKQAEETSPLDTPTALSESPNELAVTESPVEIASAMTPPAPTPLEIDPSAKILAQLAVAEEEQRKSAEADRQRLAALEAATRAARAEAEGRRRMAAASRSQLDAMIAEASRREREAISAIAERDALARKREALKSRIEEDEARPGWAVVPHKGPNGTWQRPIVIECGDARVAIRPKGPSFNVLELGQSSLSGSSPFAAAVAREAVRIQRQTAPDGGDLVPYIFFIVRPNGIRSYYEARTRLESLGIAFGYELADAEWSIAVPDLDDPASWSGPQPRPEPTAPTTSIVDRAPIGPASESAPIWGDPENPFIWPKSAPAADPLETEGLSSPRVTSFQRQASPLSTRPAGLGVYPSDRNRLGFPDLAGEPVISNSPSPEASETVEIEPAKNERVDSQRLGGFRGTSRRAEMPRRNSEKPEASVPDRWNEIWDRALKPGVSDRPVGLNPIAAKGDAQEDRRENPPARGTTAPRTMNPHDPKLTADNSEDTRAEIPPRESHSSNVESTIDNGANPDPQGVSSNVDRLEDEAATQRASRLGSTERGIASSRPSQKGEAMRGSAVGPGGGGSVRPSGPDRLSMPLPIVLACGSKGVTVHPGDYRVTSAVLARTDPLLVGQIRAIVKNKEREHPAEAIRPEIQFVIEPGGRETYAIARAQLGFAGIDWPNSVRVSGGDIHRLFSTDDW